MNEGLTSDLSDAVTSLGYLFLGNPRQLLCEKSADITDDDRLDLSDVIYFLSFKFLGGPPPPAPFNSCGLDPTPDELTCEHPSCP